jgi:peptide-methionine (S)-S-oxide reductase
MLEKMELLTGIIVVVGAFSILLLSAVSGGAEKPAARGVATFAGGCFWCMEPAFDKLDGVNVTTVGYTGGEKKDPTYEEVCSGSTGHTEAIEIEYDTSKLSYKDLLDVFWTNIDPTTPNRQFCDVGTQYRSAIFYHDEEQQKLAESTKLVVVERLQHVVATEIVAAVKFYPAEDYHQDFYKKNPDHYKSYRTGCGRDRRLEQLWGDE